MYTQLTDVEDEVNGLFTYDRAAVKPDANAVRSVNAALAAEFARVTNPAKNEQDPRCRKQRTASGIFTGQDFVFVYKWLLDMEISIL